MDEDVGPGDRPRGKRRSEAVVVSRLSLEERAAWARRYPYPSGVDRPATRGDCAQVERPCPFVSCRHHLYLDVLDSGTIVVNFPDREPWELERSCSLDEADRGAHVLEVVGARLNLTRERVRQIERTASARMSAAGGALPAAVEFEDLSGPEEPESDDH